ncbi:MAG: lytic transglycosylase domain-containing protein [Firmicutes bacterium]|nr:lytic transglycosylase domain-containing protein [Bacillota bacterium]
MINLSAEYKVIFLKIIKWFLIIAGIIFILADVGRYYLIPEVLLPTKYSGYVEKYADEYNIDKYLVYSVIKTESGFKNEAVSNKSAKGLMQITENTGKWAAEKIGIEDFDVEDLHDPETNIRIGCWYLSYLLNQFDGELSTALAAYNAGSGKVREWLENSDHSSDGITLDTIPYEETLNYVNRVSMTLYLYLKVY